MKLNFVMRVTSVATEDIGAQLNEVTIWLQDFLADNFNTEFLGEAFDQLIVVFVAVDSSLSEMESYLAAHDRCGKYKSFQSKETVRYAGLAVRMNSQILLNKDGHKTEALRLLVERLQKPLRRVPKGAAADLLVLELRRVISALQSTLKLGA
ncbi:hypothetical protein [Herbaspirillum sp. meg3]|uniref:hypothetical protein n=1 Tax=Herbaspirillum sp. meg3 TaxID=2025949 RepID=UPI0012FD60CC|nr:hypothetical protein [Herbaspirillum sp. meg3]